MRRPRNLALPKPLLFSKIVTVQYLIDAAKSSDLSHTCDDRLLAAVCTRIDSAFHALVRSDADLLPRGAEATWSVLAKMAVECHTILEPLVSQAHLIEADSEPATLLARQLSMSLDPVVLALLGAAQATSTGAARENVLAETVFALLRFEGWASAAADQFSAGIKATNAARREEVRKKAMLFGTTIIDAYNQVTGHDVAISRHPPGHHDEGKPTGPLIRFASHMYKTLRGHCAATTNLAHVAESEALAPSPETLVDWVKHYRQPSFPKKPRRAPSTKT